VEIERYEKASISWEAYGAENTLPSPAKLGWERRIVFHVRMLEAAGDEWAAEVNVERASISSRFGENSGGVEYARGKGQRDVLTGETMEVDPEWERIYRVRFDRSGILKHWEHHLDALASLRGMGGPHYNVFAGPLLKFPPGPLHAGAAWSFGSYVRIARSDTVPLRLDCRLSQDSDFPHVRVTADVLLSEKGAPDHFQKAGRIGEGVWRISRDLREITGDFGFTLKDSSGQPCVEWRDEVRVRELRDRSMK
jgi:hypothetical protein